MSVTDPNGPKRCPMCSGDMQRYLGGLWICQNCHITKPAAAPKKAAKP